MADVQQILAAAALPSESSWVVQRLAATALPSECSWLPSSPSPLLHGGDSTAVREQLADAQQIYATVHAFAAVKAVGRVVWVRSVKKVARIS